MSGSGRPPWSLSAALRPYVQRLVAYDADLGPAAVHRGLPSTTLTVVLPTGEPLDVEWAGSPDSRAERWSVLSGLHTRPAWIHHPGHQSGVQLALTVQGARALLGMPAGALARQLVQLPEACPELAQLPEQLGAATAPDDRLRVVEVALLAALRRRTPDAPRAEVAPALAALAHGAPVDHAARHVGLSRRHLGTLVRAECGLSPKAFQRVARFEASYRLLQAGPTTLADVAARTGYADQAHLAREWNSLAGCPPSTWLREELPPVRGLADGPVRA